MKFMIRKYPANLGHLHDMLSFVCEQGLKAGFRETDIYQIELAVEEALVNIITHAFGHKPGMIEIDCISDKHDYFAIVIIDQGVPYNLLNSGKMFDISGVIASQPIGGYGIFFIIKIMDEIKYQNIGKRNILTLIKYK